MIDVYNLNKSYGNLKVIENFNLSIAEGEVVALVGPSGCGKTTLLHCITGLVRDYEGTIKLDNLNSQEYLENKRIAIVLQQYSNFEWLTVRENIQIPFVSKNIIEIEESESVNNLLSYMNLNEFSNNFINELSGGMQQRVAVARALAQNTEILALDEPFGALDIQNRNSLQLFFLETQRKFKKTAIFITHDIEEAIFLSDKVAVLSKIPSTIIKLFDTRINNKDSNKLKYSSDFIAMKKEIEDTFYNNNQNR